MRLRQMVTRIVVISLALISAARAQAVGGLDRDSVALARIAENQGRQGWSTAFKVISLQSFLGAAACGVAAANVKDTGPYTTAAGIAVGVGAASALIALLIDSSLRSTSDVVSMPPAAWQAVPAPATPTTTFRPEHAPANNWPPEEKGRWLARCLQSRQEAGDPPGQLRKACDCAVWRLQDSFRTDDFQKLDRDTAVLRLEEQRILCAQ